MNCLSQLQILCWRIFARLDRLSSQVDPSEKTTRFIFAQRHFNIEKQVVESAAFLPPKDGKLSIYRIRDCSEKKVWWLGDWFVTRKRADRKNALARADLIASIFSTVNLVLRPDTNPHPRHVNVEGWPEDKPTKKMRAVELANRATLSVKK